MEDLKILLVCGSGASSGFMATNIKKEAKKQNI
ncbi:MAG: PTS sugar transporter subunit IIB, partial [Erysipelotrichaceae bacterium]